MIEVVHTVQIARHELVMLDKKLKLYQKETQNDKVLKLVIKYYNEGWPNNLINEGNKTPL